MVPLVYWLSWLGSNQRPPGYCVAFLQSYPAHGWPRTTAAQLARTVTNSTSSGVMACVVLCPIVILHGIPTSLHVSAIPWILEHIALRGFVYLLHNVQESVELVSLVIASHAHLRIMLPPAPSPESPGRLRYCGRGRIEYVAGYCPAGSGVQLLGANFHGIATQLDGIAKYKL